MYEFQFSFYGTDDCKLRDPYAVDVDLYGNIYVADTGNARIQVLNPNGTCGPDFGIYGTDDCEFKEPRGVAVNVAGNGVHVYVADSANNRIQKLRFDKDSEEFEHIMTIGGPDLGSGESEFHRPSGVAADSSGNIYVADTGNNRIVVLDPNGAYRMDFGESGTGVGQFKAPYGIAVNSAGSDVYIYVADSANHRIQKWRFDKVSEECVHIMTIGGPDPGSGESEFHFPRRVDVNSSKIYVADTSNNRVVILSHHGDPLTQFGGPDPGSGDDQFNAPYGIAVGWGNWCTNIYVADNANNRIQKWTNPYEDKGVPFWRAD